MRTPADKEPPLYVPPDFDAAHRDEARRTVVRSCLPRSRQRSPWDRLNGWWDNWTIAITAHLTAAAVTLVFTGLTRTWMAGLVVLVLVSTSLGVTLVLRNRIEAADRRDRPDRV